MALQVAQHFLATPLSLHRVDARAPQDGAAHGKDPREIGPFEQTHVAAPGEPGPAVANADDGVPVEKRASPHGADRGIETGGVTAAGEDPDLHAISLTGVSPSY